MTNAARTGEFIFNERTTLRVSTFQTDYTSRSTEYTPSRSKRADVFQQTDDQAVRKRKAVSVRFSVRSQIFF